MYIKYYSIIQYLYRYCSPDITASDSKVGSSTPACQV